MDCFCFQNLSFLAKVEFSAMRAFTFAIIMSSLCSNSCLISFKNLFMPSSLIWFSKSKKQNNANCVYYLFTYQFSCLPLTWMIWFFLEVWSLPLAPFVLWSDLRSSWRPQWMKILWIAQECLQHCLMLIWSHTNSTQYEEQLFLV